MKVKKGIIFIVAGVLVVFLALVLFSSNSIEKIEATTPGKNILKTQIDIQLKKPGNVFITYKIIGDTLLYKTPLSKNKKHHSILLLDLKPEKEYQFQVVLNSALNNKTSQPYHFKTGQLPLWLQNYVVPFEDYKPDETVMGNGLVHLYKRKTPGIFVLFDGQWNIRWYHQVEGTGIKAATFTQDNTFLGVLGEDKMRTAYGNEILEVDLAGKEKVRLRKGEKDFNKIIHHDIIKTADNCFATITVDSLFQDLSSIGGSASDTIIGDGILLLDTLGNKVWEWSVFDVINPIDDKNILNLKKDWVHANALSFDKDGHFLISFYNLNQVWKIHSTTGELIWKLGKGGDFQMDSTSYFTNQHSVHINRNGNLMLFDNGTHRDISRALAFVIDEKNKIAKTILDAPLPADIFTARMGSAYLMENGNILQCSSKTNNVVITNRNGEVLWQLKPMYLAYRAEYLSSGILNDFYSVE